MDTQWHYKDEKNGKRLGPIRHEDVQRLIAEDRIERTTLVWNTAMPEWARASSTELVSLFGDRPPPMPAGEISRWAVYVLALVPLWGVGVQAAASFLLSDRLQVSPTAMFDHRAWLLLYLVANGVFGSIDERNLERAGHRIRGAAILSALLSPVYIFMSCRTVAKYASGGWLAYLPFVLWFVAFAGGIFADDYALDLLA